MKMTNKAKKIIVIIFCISIGVFLTGKLNSEPAENLSLPSGAGFDVEKGVDGNLLYSLPISVRNYKKNAQSNAIIYVGRGYSIGEGRKDRDRMLSKRFIPGGERVFLISDAQAELGIHNILDVLYNNSNINNLSIMAICKGKSEDIFKFTPKGFLNSVEYIEGLIENIKNNNFFSDDYKLIDVFVSGASEGRSILLPYIELKDGVIKVIGTAIFKKDKMIDSLDMTDSNVLNILKFDKVTGLLSLQKDYKRFIDYKSIVKKNVKCIKKDKNYSFTINLDFTGEIVSNELYKDIDSNLDVEQQFEKDMSQKIELMCNSFIQKMKSQYKLDLIDLGRVAASEYGRNTETDWDKVISGSEINVIANVRVIKSGRGNY